MLDAVDAHLAGLPRADPLAVAHLRWLAVRMDDPELGMLSASLSREWREACAALAVGGDPVADFLTTLTQVGHAPRP